MAGWGCSAAAAGSFAATDATSAAAVKSGLGCYTASAIVDGPMATAPRSAGKLRVSGVNKSSSAIYYKVLK